MPVIAGGGIPLIEFAGVAGVAGVSMTLVTGWVTVRGKPSRYVIGQLGRL